MSSSATERSHSLPENPRKSTIDNREVISAVAVTLSVLGISVATTAIIDQETPIKTQANEPNAIQINFEPTQYPYEIVYPDGTKPNSSEQPNLMSRPGKNIFLEIEKTGTYKISEEPVFVELKFKHNKYGQQSGVPFRTTPDYISSEVTYLDPNSASILAMFVAGEKHPEGSGATNLTITDGNGKIYKIAGGWYSALNNGREGYYPSYAIESARMIEKQKAP